MNNTSIFTLTHPKGAERIYRTTDGQTGRQDCIGDIGYISGSAWAMMAIVLDGFTQKDAWQIVNLTDNQDNFLANAAVLGATGNDHAANMALRAFNGDLSGYAQASAYQVIEAPTFVLKRLLDSESRATYKGRVTEDEIRNLYQKLADTPADWDGDKLVSHRDVQQLVSEVVRYDNDQEMQQATTSKAMFDSMMDGAETDQYDAIVTQVSRLDNLSNRILVAMGKAADKVKPVNVEKSEPFKKNGVVNVAQYFTFDDGQALTIVYHNPDSTPTRLDSKDLLTSWKFLLNKRDITAALQPKSGKDVNFPVLAKRAMLLIEANSVRFRRAQERKANAQNALDELNKIEAEKREQIVALDKDIAALQAELDKPIADFVADDAAGTISGKNPDQAELKAGDDVYPRNEAGNVLNKNGQTFKTRVVADKVIKKLGLAGHVVMVVTGGYVITNLNDPTYTANGYVTVGNAKYGDRIVKAEPKLLFEMHDRQFLIVQSDVVTASNNIEVIELSSRASIPFKNDKGEDQFFHNSVSSAYAKSLDVLAGMSLEEFNKTGMAKAEQADTLTSAMIAEGMQPQIEDVAKQKAEGRKLDQQNKLNAELDALRDENGKLNPLSDNPMERVRALSEMSYSEKIEFADAQERHFQKNSNLTEDELQQKIKVRREGIMSIEASTKESPDYLKANQDLYAHYKERYDANINSDDKTLVAMFKTKLDRQKELLLNNGVSIETPEDKKEPEVTRYDVKDPNPRKRKAAGRVKLTERPDGSFDVLLEQGTVGGEYVGDVKGIKRWLATRLQSLGDAMNDQGNNWESTAEKLKLVGGPDVLGISSEPENASDLPEGVTQADLERNENLKKIRNTLKSMAEEQNPRNFTIGGKSFNTTIDAMLHMARLMAERPSQHTTADDVADALQHEINQHPKLRQYCVVMPRLDSVTAGKITNKLRRLDKAFKDSGAPITLRKTTGDSLLLSGDKPFSRVTIEYDQYSAQKGYIVSQTGRMDGQEYGELIDAILAYLNEDKSIERKRVYFSRNGKIIDTATNQLGYELKAEFSAMSAKHEAGSQDYRDERAARMQERSNQVDKAMELLNSYTDDDFAAIKMLMGGQSPAELRDGFVKKINGLPADRQKAINQLTGLRQLINDQAQELTLKEIREKGLTALKNVKKFLGRMQHDTIQGFIKRGEESEYFANKMMDLEEHINAMPVTYQTDGQGKKAIAQLHYFRGGMDWYITEKDAEGGVLQAYGYVDAGHGLEGGYINIEEVASVNAELDLYFEPKSIHAIEGTEPEATEDTTIMDNSEDAQMLDKILSGEINPQDVDMKDLEAMAIKYGDDQDSEIYTKLEKVVGLAISAKVEKAKAVK